jgi:hypothetical protein
MELELNKNVMDANDADAEHNRRLFRDKQIGRAHV